MQDATSRTGYTVAALAPDTWDAFRDLVERHNGIFGGCWCTWFHTLKSEKTFDADDNRCLKQRLVAEGRAHAALVMNGDIAVGWCQFGTPAELPNIYHRKEYDATSRRSPAYRITCIFVDRSHRHRGLSGVALRGALDLIAGSGGGLVEGYPHDNQGAKVSVLYDGTRALFEQNGFSYDRPKGSRNCVMTMQVPGIKRVEAIADDLRADRDHR